MKIRNPKTGDYDFKIEIAQNTQIIDQVEKSRIAQKNWAKKKLSERILVLQNFKEGIKNNRKEIINALSIDTGRNIISQRELDGLCGSIDRWCNSAPLFIDDSEKVSESIPYISIKKHRDPFPVLGVISPWNFPLLLSFIDAIPALLAGCAVIIKPSEVTPRFVDPLKKTINKISELEDIISFVMGDGSTGASLINFVDMIAFTGSVATGKKVAQSAAKSFIPACLELGGKDPVIVMDDSDLERATTSILRASTVATGQACQSLERIYVDASIHDDFINLITKKSMKLQLNLSENDDGVIGPLIFEKQAEIISNHIDDAINKGAIIHCGGKIENHLGGLWIKPTVISNVNHNMDIMTKETFGPIMPIMIFNTIEEAINLANDSKYGLSGAIFSRDEDQAVRIAERIHCGGMSINDAGLTSMIFEEEKNTYKDSGMGPSRNGAEGFTRFYRKKALFINRGDVISIQEMYKK
jgi:succinate-semialdehyde dehydrogenase / glutarate-semialdehyde dehydrogenase